MHEHHTNTTLGTFEWNQSVSSHHLIIENREKFGAFVPFESVEIFRAKTDCPTTSSSSNPTNFYRLENSPGTCRLDGS